MHTPLPIIIGTAGHVDHGKTSLVKSLSNFETDRHPEEKARGMSIDFAVAPYFIDETRVVGIVDVPGHIDFIRNMTAGASSIDIALLIVAGDDGIMPQTREHIQILSHLGVKLILPIVTKIDLSDKSLLGLLVEELELLLSESKLKYLETSYVSNLTGEGIEELKAKLSKAVEDILVADAKSVHAKNLKAFRMYIRTAFNFKGTGTVVTGIPSSGELNVDQKVQVLPSKDIHSSVRSIQNYREVTNFTQAHISSAINIRGVEVAEVERGMVLVESDVFLTTKEIYAWVKNTSQKEIVRARAYQVHIGTLCVTGLVYPIGEKSIMPQTEGMLRIKFHKEIQTSAGDRFLIREAITYGGGQVLSIFGRGVRRKHRDEKLNQLEIAKKHLIKQERFDLCELVSCGEHFLSDLKLSAILQNSILEEPDGEGRKIRGLTLNKEIRRLGKNLWFNLHQKESFEDKLKGVLSYYHKTNPYQPGMQISNLDRIFRVEGLTSKDLQSVLGSESRIQVNGNYVLLKSFIPPFSQKELGLIEKIKLILEAQPGISKVNLLAELKVTDKDLSSVFDFLEKGKIVFNFSNFYFSSEFVFDLRKKAQGLLIEKPEGFTMAEFREKTGVSRNQAVPVLDYLDREGVTKRVGDRRVRG